MSALAALGGRFLTLGHDEGGFLALGTSVEPRHVADACLPACLLGVDVVSVCETRLVSSVQPAACSRILGCG